ncbi:hypothetical protein RRG08_034740 [Elysia crispata]|uniref:Uncharacterized protein n=1 Tax=Elysia crispata TaxID=231223 RepID=A0AAE0Y259_9GAST|nr:hypothetical protein RRG08_034740 [Elysia crispata]
MILAYLENSVYGTKTTAHSKSPWTQSTAKQFHLAHQAKYYSQFLKFTVLALSSESLWRQHRRASIRSSTTQILTLRS